MLLELLLTSFLGLSGPADAPSPSVLAALEREQTSLFTRLGPSVVFITTGQGFGSGFIVSSEGHVLTNRHVVGDRERVRVVLQDGRSMNAHVLARGVHDGDEVDVALLQLPLQNTPAVTFGSSRDVAIGAWIGSVGHGSGGIWTFGAGLVSNAHGQRESGVLQTQIPLNPGASGGPLFDRNGAVVGIVTAGITGANAINFALTVEAAALALPQFRPLCNCLTVHASTGTPVYVDGRLVGQGPVVVVVAPPETVRVETVEGQTRRSKTVSFPRQREVNLR